MAKYQLESVTQRGVALAHRVACRGVARQCVWHGVSWRHASFFCDMFIPTHATPAPAPLLLLPPLLLLMLLFNKVQRPSSWHYRRSNRTWCEVYVLIGGHSENIRASTWTLLWLELYYLLRESNLNSAISFIMLTCKIPISILYLYIKGRDARRMVCCRSTCYHTTVSHSPVYLSLSSSSFISSSSFSSSSSSFSLPSRSCLHTTQRRWMADDKGTPEAGSRAEAEALFGGPDGRPMGGGGSPGGGRQGAR